MLRYDATKKTLNIVPATREETRDEILDSLALILHEIVEYRREIRAAEAAKAKFEEAERRMRGLFAEYSRILALQEGGGEVDA